MALSFSTNCANAMLKGLLNHITDGSEAITLRIYSGSMPSNANDNLSTGNAVLASFAINRPISKDPADKTLTFIPFSGTTALAAGTATFFRLGRSNTAFLQGTTSEAGGSGDLKLNKSTLTLGEAVRVIEVKFILP